MFDSTPVYPPDAVFGIAAEYRKDSNPDKINLTVGMYQDESGKIPVMDSVHRVELDLAKERGSRVYLPIDGLQKYNDQIAKLILGDTHPAITEGRVATAQTPGGTAALRVAGDLLRRIVDAKTIWISNPSWANHPQIYNTVGLEVKRHDYLDQHGTGMDFEAVIKSLSTAAAGDVVLLHTVCHNPTGVDPSPEQWVELLNLVREKQLVPIFDFAYQGFGEGLNEDAKPIRDFCADGGQALICNSFSKNFNLYGERVGGITAVGGSPEAAAALLSQIKSIIRTNYSNPPTHGAAIVARVLSDPELRKNWEQELNAIRNRIGELRSKFVQALDARTPGNDFSHINRQRGMFSYSGISAENVDRLKNEYSIYLLRSGRVNIAGINEQNLDPLCDAIAAVVGAS